MIPDVTEQPEMEYVEWVSKDGRKKRQAKWFLDALKSGADRAKIRSKTFHGVAVAMATQWTEDISKGE